MASELLTPSPTLAAAIAQFDPDAARGYLAAASIGLPTADTAHAMADDLALWRSGRRDPMGYEPIVEASRGHFARLIGVDVDRVAIAGQTSVMTSVVAAAVPRGARVVCVDGDFTSIVFPFLQRGDIEVVCVPLDELAASVTDDTWLVVFSLVQSADGRVADVDAVVAAAEAHGAFTLCDVTQAAGVCRVDGARFDVVVDHAYKWLCCPRGVGFMALSERFDHELTPIQAGWYAGERIWESIYAPGMRLAQTARRFDISPAWQSWAGAEPALSMFAGLDIDEVWARTTALGDQLCDALGIEQQHQAIVTWPDADGSSLAALSGAGIKVSGRAGRLRAAFHLWNNEHDVRAVANALAR